MPVGTSFENSAMKASFSLSSLRPNSGCFDSPENVRRRSERAYNSLTKKRKESEKDNWRRSWGTTSSREDCKDDFWAALQANYNYIMDNNLIDSCKETNRELVNVEDAWSFKEFLSQFSELYSWLNRIQEAVYSKEETIKSSSLSAFMDQLEHKKYRRVVFTEQANWLLKKYPEINDEVSWRLAHLNTKWDAVQQAISLVATPQDFVADVTYELRCLKRWVKEMELRLQPLNFRASWTLQELEEKALEHMVLQRDIESHGKVVTSVVKLCKVAPSPSRKSSPRLRTALALERRWHLLFLRSLEWQCHIETLAKRFSTCSDGLEDSDLEPVHKQPRLSSVHNYEDGTSSSEYEKQSNDSETGSYFEDEISQICSMTADFISSETKDSCPNMNGSNGNMTADIQPLPLEKQRHSTSKEKKRKTRSTPAEESAHITKIDYNGPNNVTYYCQHNETDSGDAEMQSVDESSDDEWAFTNHQKPVENTNDKTDPKCEGTNDKGTNNKITNVPLTVEKSPPKKLDLNKVVNSPKLSKNELSRLVMNAEILANTPVKQHNPRTFEPVKYRRVKEWLNHSNSESSDSKSKAEDQCDASGEYTTGESDVERESQSSEDLNESVATFRQMNCGYTSQATSTEVISNLEMTPVNEKKPFPLSEYNSCSKVNMRPKRSNARSNRPWSVACISTLSASKTPRQKSKSLSHFSISESALHELDMALLSVTPGYDNSRLKSTENMKPGYLRRQKSMHARKRIINRKSDSGSDSQNCYQKTTSSPLVNVHNSNSNCNMRNIIKSGSFSGHDTPVPANIPERCTASDPSNNYISTTSGADSEEDKKIINAQKPVPNFKLGLAEINNPPRPPLLNERDSSSEKVSITPVGTEEQMSFLSEWDNYYEKYMSETYSETPDSEAARRLLDFGEDYRNYIDSQSDCCSSMSTTHTNEYSPVLIRRRRTGLINDYNSASAHHRSNLHRVPLDSESDLEEFRHVIQESHVQLEHTDELFSKQLLNCQKSVDPTNLDSMQIIVACRENLRCLQVMLKCQGNSLTTSEFHDVKGLVESWTTMQTQASELQRACSLQRQMAALRDDLKSLSNRTSYTDVRSREDLDDKIDFVKNELCTLQDCKRKLLQINVSVHRLLTDNTFAADSKLKSVALSHEAAHTASGQLKDDVAELYRLWAEINNSSADHLAKLEQVATIWSQWEARLRELRGVLRGDESTLRMLDGALKDGDTVSVDVASSVRDVAKLLSEKQCCQNKSIKSCVDDPCNTHIDVLLDGSGSISDSGISDEGSEQELSEREKRLAGLRRLVRQLEAALSPDSEVLQTMSKRMQQTETELRDLQRICRALIVRTAVCAEVRVANQQPAAPAKDDIVHSTRKSRRSSNNKKSQNVKHNKGGDPSEPDPSKSFLWRVIRASLPFQLAIVAVLCVACLLQPHCCERLNNMNTSLTPQLRYVKGPPPV